VKEKKEKKKKKGEKSGQAFTLRAFGDGRGTEMVGVGTSALQLSKKLSGE
jgi:hypothetical protein